MVAIQFGAILAVLGLFWRRFVQMLQGLVGRNPDGRHLLITLVVAFLPAGVLGAALDSKIEDTLFGPWPIVIAWIVGGALILVLERTGRIPDADHLDAGRTRTLTDITYRQALIIGLAQCIALVPGTSRSLATIIGALLIGVAMPAAVEFSFLLGFGTLTAATLFKLTKDGGTLVDQFGILDPLIGAAFAFVSAVLAIRWLISYLSRHDLTIFAWYRFIVAADHHRPDRDLRHLMAHVHRSGDRPLAGSRWCTPTSARCMTSGSDRGTPRPSCVTTPPAGLLRPPAAGLSRWRPAAPRRR